MEDTFKDFSVDIRGAHKKTFSVTNSQGSFEFYNYIAHNKFNLYHQDRGRTMRIIRKVGDYIREYLAQGKDIDFPHGLGNLSIRARDSANLDQQGNVRIHQKINWYDTLKLWFEDDDARENKVLVRHTSPRVFVPVWEKTVLHKNISYYKFFFNRILKEKLKENIKNGTVVDAPCRYTHEGFKN